MNINPFTKADFDRMNDEISKRVPNLEFYANDPARFDAVLDPEQPFDDAQPNQDRWNRILREASDRNVYDRRIAAHWVSAACDIEGSPYVLRSLIRRMELHSALDDRIPRPEGGDLSPLLLSPDCAGAYALSDSEKARIRALDVRRDESRESH